MSTIQNELQKFAQWLDMVRNTNDPLWRNMSIWGNNNAYQLMLINFHNDFPMEQRDLEGSPSAGVDKMEDQFIKKHLNRIQVMMGSTGIKRLFIQCMPQDKDAFNVPNGNLWLKEIFIPEEVKNFKP